MSRKGNCLDNSPMENFFGKMKNEMFYGYEYTFNTLDELQKEMEDYIYYYNNQRITTKLKGLTPVEYRNQSLILISSILILKSKKVGSVQNGWL